MYDFYKKTILYFRTQNLVCKTYYFIQFVLFLILYYGVIGKIYDPNIVFHFLYGIYLLIPPYYLFIRTKHFIYVNNFIQWLYVTLTTIVSTLLWATILISKAIPDYFYLVAIASPIIFNNIIPAILSIPFKMISSICGLNINGFYLDYSPNEIEKMLRNKKVSSLSELYEHDEINNEILSQTNYKVMTKDQLQKRLEDAVEKEDYETAEKIKQILNKKFS